MSDDSKTESAVSDAEVSSGDDTPTADNDNSGRPREIGGRKGPEPTRYGDWEKAGRCIDF